MNTASPIPTSPLALYYYCTHFLPKRNSPLRCPTRVSMSFGRSAGTHQSHPTIQLPRTHGRMHKPIPNAPNRLAKPPFHGFQVKNSSLLAGQKAPTGIYTTTTLLETVLGSPSLTQAIFPRIFAPEELLALSFWTSITAGTCLDQLLWLLRLLLLLRLHTHQVSFARSIHPPAPCPWGNLGDLERPSARYILQVSQSLKARARHILVEPALTECILGNGSLIRD